MIKIRKGNDFVLTWQVIINDGETTLEELEGVSFELTDANGDVCPIEWEIDEDKANIRFLGKDQKRIGAYKLTLWVKRGERGQAVIDRCDAFYLTSCSDKADINGTESAEICPEVLIDSVDFAVGIRGEDGITPHIDDTTGNWFIGDEDTGVHAQGEPGEDGIGEAPEDGKMYGRKNGEWGDIKEEVNAYTKPETDVLLNAKQGVINDLETIREGAAAGAEAQENAFQHLFAQAPVIPYGQDALVYVSDVDVDSLDPTQLNITYGVDIKDGYNSIETHYAPASTSGVEVVKSISQDSANSRELDVHMERVPSMSEFGSLSNLTTTAKSNLVAAINEVAQGGGASAQNAVRYTAQTLTSSQKEQARTNIDAISNTEDEQIDGSKTFSGDTTFVGDVTIEDSAFWLEYGQNNLLFELQSLVEDRTKATLVLEGTPLCSIMVDRDPIADREVATKQYVDSNATSLVHTTGTETIAGEKTFSDPTNMKAVRTPSISVQIEGEDDSAWLTAVGVEDDDENGVLMVQGTVERLYSIAVDRDPVSDLELATKQYVDNLTPQIAEYTNDEIDTLWNAA